jgi:hypothetical protein
MSALDIDFLDPGFAAGPLRQVFTRLDQRPNTGTSVARN